MDRIQSYSPFEVKIIENFDVFVGENVDNADISTANTGTLLNTYVDSIETDLDLEKLKLMLHELYIEAQQIESV